MVLGTHRCGNWLRHNLGILDLAFMKQLASSQVVVKLLFTGLGVLSN